MYIKVFPHGKGNGKSPTHYLVRLDYPHRKENPPVVLRGNVEETQRLIDCLETKWKFTAGVLSWHPDDVVSPEKEQEIMNAFENLAFAGLEQDQRNILWVRHSHANHHELHFVIPRVELYGGKAYNPCPPGWQKSFDVLRDYFNIKENWARPDDPKRARLYLPEQADLNNARLIRWGRTPLKKEEREQAKEALHSYIIQQIEYGKIKNRIGIIQALQDIGLQINRQGKDYITVVDPTSKEKLRLKGAMYAEQFDLTDRENQSQSGTGTERNRSNTQAKLSKLAGELERVIQKRTEYNRKRYPQQPLAFGTQYQNRLPEYSKPLQQPLSQSPFMEHSNNHHNESDSSRNNWACPLSNKIFEGRAAEFERTDGTNRSRIPESLAQIQRAGIIPVSGRELFADTAKLADNPLRNKRETECLENQQGLKEQLAENILTNCHNEIIIKNNQKQSKMIKNNQKSSNIIKKEQDDDRTGTHTQGNSAVLAAGIAANTNQSANQTQSAGTNTAKLDRTNNISHGTKSGFTINFDPIRRNLATLNQCIQQLKSFVAILANIPKKQIKNKEISR